MSDCTQREEEGLGFILNIKGLDFIFNGSFQSTSRLRDSKELIFKEKNKQKNKKNLTPDISVNQGRLDLYPKLPMQNLTAVVKPFNLKG